jgi:hypothetical protein
MSDDLESSLIKLYKAMPSATIERRLATADLTQLARGVAQNELQKRAARAEAEDASPTLQADEPPATSRPASHTGPIAFVLFTVIAAGVLSLIVPHYAFLFCFVAILTVASFLAKAYPRVGLAVGSLLLLSAAGLGFWYLLGPSHDGLEMVLYFIFTVIAVFLLAAVGWSMVQSARDRQPWGQFVAMWEGARKKSDSAMTERD